MKESSKRNAGGEELALALQDDNTAWYKHPHLLKLNAIILSLLMFSGSLGYDASMMNGLQALTEWQTFMHHPVGEYLGFINALPFIGGLVMYPISAFVADKFGRKICLYVCLLSMALGTGLTTGASNPSMFILGRLFVGIAMGWTSPASILITEIAHPLHRSKVTALYNCQFYVGSTLAAWAEYGVRNLDNSWTWRVPALLQIGIPIFALYGTFLSPESPRWLVAQGRLDEARNIIAKYHAGGDSTLPIVAFEMAEIEKSIALERDAYQSSGYLDLLKTKGNRHRLLISISLAIFSQWIGNGVVSYYLTLILDTVGITSVTDQTLINAFLNIFNLIMAVGASLTVDRFGRRTLFLASVSIMLISYIIITALSATFAEEGNRAAGTAVIPLLFIFFAGYDIAFTPLVVAYPAEIWSFTLRARGLAVTNATAFVALLFNVFVNPIALAAIAWKYYLVFISILIIALVSIFFGYPETRGHTLEEMAIVFDGADAAIPSSDEVMAKVEFKQAEQV